MKLIFSRKGFDSSAGGVPSPIYQGHAISLPIPSDMRSDTSYDDLGVGFLVEYLTRGRLIGRTLCHNDPMFENGRCAFGQTGAAQTHLENNGVGIGDTFLFFGLFSHMDGRDRHHRIFGYMTVEQVLKIGSHPKEEQSPIGFSHQHPHTIGEWHSNNTIYVGPGHRAEECSPALRLTKRGASASLWHVPEWLKAAGLTYHGDPDRWGEDETLQTVSRGQEFVTDIFNDRRAQNWLKIKKRIVYESLEEETD